MRCEELFFAGARAVTMRCIAAIKDLIRLNTSIAVWFVGTACGSAAAHHDVIADAITPLLEDCDSVAADACVGSAFIDGLHGLARERRPRSLYALIHLRW